MSETEEAASTDLVADIAALVRQLAKQEPYKSASSPGALLALAAYLDVMVAETRPGRSLVVNVAVRSRRKRSG